jgi:hypothetical protein
LLVVGAVVLAGGFLVGLWALLTLGSVGRDDTAPFEPVRDNGAFFTRVEQGGRVVIVRHPIDGSGAFATPVTVYDGPGSTRTGPAVVDGRSPNVLLGWYSDDGVSDSLQVVADDNGEVLESVDADRWCGGEGPDGMVCTLLDARRLARTTALAPGVHAPVALLVTSLQDGATLSERAFPGLQAVLGTESPDHVVLQIADPPTGETGGDPAGPDLPTGEMVDLDLSSGRMTTIGRYDAGWAPLCVTVLRWQPDGRPEGMSVVGVLRTGQGPTDRLSLRGLGPAQVEAITWPAAQGFEPAGCSADGRYVYLLALQPDDEGVTRAVVDRVSVADGERARALPAAPEIPGPWTR